MKAFYTSYGLQESTPDIPALRNKLSGNIYSQIKNDLDFDKVQMLSSATSLIYIIALKQENKFYSVKFTERLEPVEVFYSGKMEDDNNGTIGILKDGEALAIEFKNGVKIIKSMTLREYTAHFTQSGKDGFCQGEPNVPFEVCYNREIDEFCDSFVSCIALATNPSISIFIALACSCNSCACK